LLADGVTIPISATGAFRIEASLVDASGKEQARGRDEIFALDWKNAQLPANGAVWESGRRVRDFLAKQKALDVPAYADSLEKLDWIIAARPPNEGEPSEVPAEVFRDPE